MAETPKLTQEMIQLYDDFTHSAMDRRTFMGRLAVLAGGTAAATAAASLLGNNYALAATIAPEDDRIVGDDITFPGASGEVGGYLVRPADAEGPLPAVIVIHENRGLNPHIRDVARRLAVEGFVALAVDFLSPLGGTPDSEDAASELHQQMDIDLAVENAQAARRFLADHELSNGNVGAVGFCWGGGLVNRLAAADPDLAAGVAYYGGQVDAEAAANIEASLLLHYAELDERINAGIADYEAALDAARVDYELHMYEGVNHAFNNDTNAARYDAEAAALAWQRTVDFFRSELA